jgi:hypothetical protein
MDATPPRKRPWYRLHLSTYFVLLVPLTVLVLVGAPGYKTDDSSWEHGWPLVHLVRRELADSFAFAPPRPSDTPPWLRWAQSTGAQDGPFALAETSGWRHAAGWKQTGTVVVVHKTALAANLLVAAAICAAVAGPYEWWRRRRFRYSLRSLLVFFLVAAVALGWCRRQANTRGQERTVIEQLEKLGCEVSERYWGPVWLARLVGEHYPFILRCPDEVSGPADDPGEEGMIVRHAPGMFNLVVTLPTVRCLSLRDTPTNDRQWAQLAEMKNLEQLDFPETQISDFAIACLVKLPKLRTLGVRNPDGATRAKLQKALPKCKIEDLYR